MIHQTTFQTAPVKPRTIGKDLCFNPNYRNFDTRSASHVVVAFMNDARSANFETEIISLNDILRAISPQLIRIPQN